MSNLILTKYKENLFNHYTTILIRDNEGASQWAATQEWHSKASISGGVSRHRAGIPLRGALGDIWLQLQEGQMCRFDGKETCQLRIPTWQRRHIRGKTSPNIRTPLSFSKARGAGVQIRALVEKLLIHWSICTGESLNARYKIKGGN